ncbi:thymidylate synthase [Bacillus phage Shbh1]|uniref:thymidylate synthase n=1 Tax=Bacillus phage Shbh1 TaxID=1796992 RepID=A0A142F1B1_9CAUD|nr:thymidylate synthase [Bacillus phage Shbh1]AMQ66568.1 thymidylate synthase-like protein [Bacillus phage Shbh1]
MNNTDKEYLNLAEKILKEGSKKKDRTGTGTLSLFGPQMEFDLTEGFPILTTKKVPFRVVAEELFWFISGSTNLKDLLDKNVNIWNPDAYRFYKEQGGDLEYTDFIDKAKKYGFCLGPIYGEQWVRWGERQHGLPVNQIKNVIEQIKSNPNSRRLLVTAWNPSVLDEIALPSCHTMFQFYVDNGTLSCKLYQRSSDFFLGVPFNIASYALLTHLIAHTLDLKVGKFIHTFGDCHIYLNHTAQIQTQLQRTPKKLPTLHIKQKHEYIGDYSIDDIELIGYNPHPTIKGDVSVGL